MLLTPHHGDPKQARLMSDLRIMIKAEGQWGRLERSATIWASSRTRDPCFEIIGASLLPCCVGFDAFSTLGIEHFWIFTQFHPFPHFICICKGYLDHVFCAGYYPSP